MKVQFAKSAAALIGLAFSAQALAEAPNSLPPQKPKSGDSTFRMSAGVDYSSGKYGDTVRTNVLSAPISFKYSNKNISFRVSVPFVNVRGPGSLLTTPEGRTGTSNLDLASGGSGRSGNSGPSSSGGGSGSSGSGSGSSGGGSGSSGSSGSGGSGSSGGGSGSSGSGGSGSSGGGSGSSGGGGSSGSGSSGGSGGSGGGGSSGSSGSTSTGTTATSIAGGNIIGGGANRNQSGIGDVNMSLTYSFDFGDDLYLDLTAKVKLPTASKAKRFGTGKVDFIAAAELSKSFGNVDIYAGGRRRFAGSTVLNPIRDTWAASTGIGFKPVSGLRLGLDYDWQQASFTGGKASSEITGSANIRLNSKMNLNLYATTGLNSASVDIGAGAAISFRF